MTILLTLDQTWFHRLGLSRFTYVRSLERAGASVRMLSELTRLGDETDRDAARRLLEGVDGLVLSGGGDVDPKLYGGDSELARTVRPHRDRFELALLAEARLRGLPVLGICRGAQLLNVSRGGTLRTIRFEPARQRRHGRMRWHAVDLEPESRVARVFGTERLEGVVSYHGQAVELPGDGLVITGRAEDRVAEAIEPSPGDEDSWLLGVQWHPELSPRSVSQRRLFAAFVEAARGFGVSAASTAQAASPDVD